MFKGTVNFIAKIRGNGMTFPLFEFNPNEPGVDKVEIEGPHGDEIKSTVYLACVATQDDGRAVATRVNRAVLDRICFFHGIAIEKARISDDQFSPLMSQPGVLATAIGEYVYIGDKVSLTIGIPATKLKNELEQASPAGERHFGLFRSARQSESPVEEFMQMYRILLELNNDSQPMVDEFILSEDPDVPQNPSPIRPGVLETIYTRLRNELAHHRAGVRLDNTKAEMGNRLGGLMAIVKRAIELHPW